MIFDPDAVRVGKTSNVFGSFLCVLVNIPYIFFFKVNSKLNEANKAQNGEGFFSNIRNQVMCQILIQTFGWTLWAIFIDGAEISLSDKGIFGHLRSDHFFYILFYMGFVAGLCGTIGVIFALKFFPSILIMNLCLTRPLISQTMGIYLGIDELPGLMTYLGCGMVIGAIYMINNQ